MPNMCYNRLFVRAENETPEQKQMLKLFIQQAKTIVSDETGQLDSVQADFNLRAFLPLPDALVGSSAPHDNPDSNEAKLLREQFGFDNWYEWQIANWGCKWDVSDVSVTISDSRFFLNFETPWTPPIIAIKKIAKQFPLLKITLEYCEPGEGITGDIVLRGETILDENSYDEVWEQFREEEEHDCSDGDCECVDNGCGCSFCEEVLNNREQSSEDHNDSDDDDDSVRQSPHFID